MSRPDPDEVVQPTLIEGRCAWCVCGERLEIPAPPPRGATRQHRIRCQNCVRIVEVIERRDP